MLLSILAIVPARGTGQDLSSPDKPRLRQQYFDLQRAYPFDRIPEGALQRALRALRERGPLVERAAAIAPSNASGGAWQPLGPAPIANLDAGRVSSVAVHPVRREVLYIGAAQGGVWKTSDGGVSWTALTDTECSLALGSVAIDPANPDIVYAGTGELHFSGDSYYGCGVLRSTDGGSSWQHLGAEVFGSPSGGARISRILVDGPSAGSSTATTLYAASNFGVFRSHDSGIGWVRVLEGMATDMVADPTNPRTLYVAIGNPSVSAANGVYRSADGGSTWARLDDGFPSVDVGRISVAIAPSAPTILYAAVQNALENPRAAGDGEFLGMWKSTDAGASWMRLEARNASCGTQCWYDLVVAVHPTDADRVYFGGVLLYRSLNGGASFSVITSGTHVDQHALAFDPFDPEVMYVGNDGGIYRSSNGGRSWTSLNGNLAITQFYAGIGLHPSDANAALGGTQDNGTLEYGGNPSWTQVLGADGGFTAVDFLDPATAYAETQWTPGSSFSGPRRRDEPGAFAIRKVAGIDLSDAALFIPPLVMDRVDSHVLYFGTIRLYRTSDRGETWLPISGALGRTAGGRVSAIAPAAADPGTVYVGTSDGNVQVTRDGGSTWQVRTSGLPNRFVTDIAVDPLDASRAVLTVSGFGTGHVFRTDDAGESWRDASADLPDLPVNAVVWQPSLDAIYLGTDLGVFRSNEDGTGWLAFNDAMPNVAVFDLAYNAATGHLVAATHGRGMFAYAVVVAESIALSHDSLRFVAIGDTIHLSAEAIDATGAVVDLLPVWRSLNPLVASVGATGVVRSAGNGETFIVGTLGGRSDMARVHVEQVVARVTGLPDTASLVTGERRDFTATALDANGVAVESSILSWSSSEPRVASVDGNGQVTAASPGTANITAGAGGRSDTLTASVSPPAVLAITGSAAGVQRPSSGAGTRIPFLRLRLTVDGIEPVHLIRFGIEVSGEDPGARLLLIRDQNDDGAADSTEPVLGEAPALLADGVPVLLEIRPASLLVETGRPETLLLALHMSGAAPNGAAFSMRLIPEDTRSVGVRSGAMDRLQQPSGGVASGVVRTTLLGTGQVFTMSENPVRSHSVTFNFNSIPARAEVYTSAGRRVVDLLERVISDGSILWDLTNSVGAAVGPGVYLLVVEVDERRILEKLLILRPRDEPYAT